MQIDWWIMAGLVGVVLVVSGSNVLVDFRGWCQGFESPWQPLRWIGLFLEFVGLVTDKSMATAFVAGLWWWSGSLPWSGVVILSGLLVIATSVTDQTLALLHGVTVRLMGSSGGGPSPAPFPIPRTRGRAGGDMLPPPDRMPVEGQLPSGRPLTEEEAFASLDGDDDNADVDRGALVRFPADRR